MDRTLACIFLFIGLFQIANGQVFHGLKQRGKSPFRFPEHLNKTEIEQEISLLRNKSKYGVDGDPDFIVAVQDIDVPLCFHVGGQQGEVLRLVQHQPQSRGPGLFVVNAKIIERNETRKTYLGSVAILRGNVRILASRKNIKVNNNRFDWTNMSAFLLYGHRIIIGQNLLAISFRNRNVTLVIRRHLLPPEVADETLVDETSGNDIEDGIVVNEVEGMIRDGETVTTGDEGFRYLGFYIADSRGLNEYCHGLLGQFVHKRAEISGMTYRNQKTKGRLRVYSPGNYHIAPRVTATLSNRANLGNERAIDCWMVRREGEGVIDGDYIDYMVTDIRNKDIIRFH